MEPSNIKHWSDVRFVNHGEITFWIYANSEMPTSEMLAAVVLADRENPWWDAGRPSRLSVSRPVLSLWNDEFKVYTVSIQSACTLTASQLPAFIRYTAKLAETTHKHMDSQEAVRSIGSVVNFGGTTIRYNAAKADI